MSGTERADDTLSALPHKVEQRMKISSNDASARRSSFFGIFRNVSTVWMQVYCLPWTKSIEEEHWANAARLGPAQISR